MLKKEGKIFGEQSKSYDGSEILIYRHCVSEFITASLHLNISIKKTDRVMSMVLGKSTRKDIEKLRSAGAEFKFMKKVLVTWRKKS